MTQPNIEKMEITKKQKKKKRIYTNRHHDEVRSRGSE